MEEHAKDCYRERPRGEHAPPPDAVQTGIGNPGDHVATGGAALGGDTGDVGLPRDELGTGPGDPHGVSARQGRPDAVERVECAPTPRRRRRAA